MPYRFHRLHYYNPLRDGGATVRLWGSNYPQQGGVQKDP